MSDLALITIVVFVFVCVVQRTLIEWKLSLRREWVLLHALADLQHAGADEALFAAALLRGTRLVEQELGAQYAYAMRPLALVPWPMPPPPGEPWPT